MMKPRDVTDGVKRKGGIKTVLAVTIGTASAIFLALRVRKDLYGPGGTKLSRYNRSIDKSWPRKKD